MIGFFLEKVRKLVRSIGKLEFNIIDRIILNNNLRSNNNVTVNDSHFKRINNEFKSNKNLPKKMVIVVCFYYSKKKLKILSKTLHNLSLYRFKKDITILTNNLNIHQKKILKKIIIKNRVTCSIKEIKDLPENNLLPWYSLNLMREKIKKKNNSHFMFLEDDIIVNDNNIKYWIYFRKILKKNNLIPGFIRYEKYKGKKFSVDNPEKINLKKLPKIVTKSNKNGFVNPKFPYHAMYLMDRDLMKKYLSSNAINLDFGFTNKIMKSQHPIKELANVSHAYFKTPKGYRNNFMVPFEEEKKLPFYCLIQHNVTKYVNFKKLNKMGFGTININDLII